MPAPSLPDVHAEGGTPSRRWSFTADNTRLTEVRQFDGVPPNIISMMHPEFSYLWLDSLEADEISSGVYNASLTWNSRSVHSNAAGVYKPIIKYGTWMLRRIVERDLETGLPIQNKAGDPFETMPERDIPQPFRSITVRRNAYPSSDEAFIGSCNSAAFSIAGVSYPKYCATLDGIEASEERADPTSSDPYWICTYSFRLSTHAEGGERIGFRASILNQGYCQKVGGQKVSISGDDNVTLSKPSLLDAAGAVTTAPLYLNFAVLEVKNFASLDLPGGT